MNFTNINDPAGVKALLDQLRVSQAWKDAVAPQTQESQSSSPASEQQAAPVAASVNLPQTASSASVATLLSQLQPSTWRSSQPNANNTIIGHSLAPPPAVPPLSSTPSVRNTQDPRTLTFQQALPLIAQLADDPKFVAAITQLKKEQDDLERRLWEDRRDIIRKYEEKVKVATTKAALIGEPGLSKHEANMLQDGLKKALEKFDRERVLTAWDGLVSKQQTVLSHHNVPTMFSTTQPTDRERQQRVMDVLEGILRT